MPNAVTVSVSTDTCWAMYHGSIESLRGQVCEVEGFDPNRFGRHVLRVCLTQDVLTNVRRESFTVLNP